jgi:hypothetical protein
MGLQQDVTELRTILEQTLGPNGHITKTLGEIRGDLKEHFSADAKVQADLNLRLDRLEQKQKQRSKLFWAATTSWVGIVVAWGWDRLSRH